MLKEIQAKSILVPSKLPDTDYVINPYTGCAFGCSYCYASFMGRFVDKKIEDWGTYVYPKVNLATVLNLELSKIKDKNKSIFLSSVTDPYQGLEAKYKLTRTALELLLKHKWTGSIGILTKSPLVIRDIDLFKQMPNVEVGLTITSADDSVSNFLERFAPPASLRIKALEELNKAGIHTYAFIGPLLPHFSATPKKLRKIFDALQKTGVKKIYIEHINLSNYIKKRLMEKIKGIDKNIISKFYSADSRDYERQLEEIIANILKDYDFKLRLNEIISHK
jgi:DNA repair photolyase